MDANLDANIALWRVYSPRTLFESRMPGLWAQDLFSGRFPFRHHRDARSHPPDVPADAVCSHCHCVVRNAVFELDHVQPFWYRGDNGEKQWLCAACNHCKSNRVQGCRSGGRLFTVKHGLPSLLSEFSRQVFDCLITQRGLPSFRCERLYQDPPDQPLRSIDCAKQYSTALYTATHRWIQFSKLDRVEDFDGTVCDGVFFVTAFRAPFDDLTWEGPLWYPRSWVEYHLNETGYIGLTDITHVIKASFSYPADLFQPLVEEVYTSMGPDIGKLVINRFIGLWEIVAAKGRADHFITESQEEMMAYIMTRCPPDRSRDDPLLHADMFVKRCKREGMQHYFELFTGYDRPQHTRLHLPMAAQLRSYAAIWVSRFLREHFACNMDNLVAVFRDQIIYKGSDHLERLAANPPHIQPPYSWWFKMETVNPDKLQQICERSTRTDSVPRRIPAPPRHPPQRVEMFADAELEGLADRRVHEHQLLRAGHRRYR